MLTNSTSQIVVTSAPRAVNETITEPSRLGLTSLQNCSQNLQTCGCREALTFAGGAIGAVGGGYGASVLNTLLPNTCLHPLLICSGSVSTGLFCGLGCYYSVAAAIDNYYRSRTYSYQTIESESDSGLDSGLDSESEEPELVLLSSSLESIDFSPPSCSDIESLPPYEPLEPLLSYDSPPPYSSFASYEPIPHASLALNLQPLPSYEETINSTQAYATFSNAENQ